MSDVIVKPKRPKKDTAFHKKRLSDRAWRLLSNLMEGLFYKRGARQVFWWTVLRGPFVGPVTTKEAYWLLQDMSTGVQLSYIGVRSRKSFDGLADAWSVFWGLLEKDRIEDARDVLAGMVLHVAESFGSPWVIGASDSAVLPTKLETIPDVNTHKKFLDEFHIFKDMKPDDTVERLSDMHEASLRSMFEHHGLKIDSFISRGESLTGGLRVGAGGVSTRMLSVGGDNYIFVGSKWVPAPFDEHVYFNGEGPGRPTNKWPVTVGLTGRVTIRGSNPTKDIDTAFYDTQPGRIDGVLETNEPTEDD